LGGFGADAYRDIASAVRAGRQSDSRRDRVTFRRLAAIALIFVASCVAWAILGTSVTIRSELDQRLENEVRLLWGAPHRQVAPDAWIDRAETETAIVENRDPSGAVSRQQTTTSVLRAIPAVLESTRATVDLELEHRQRGLLWYPTYSVAFNATYTFRNPDQEARALHVRLPLPAEQGLYDDFVFTLAGRPSAQTGDISKEMRASTVVSPGASAVLDVQYRSRGLRQWTYAFAPTGVAQVRDFEMVMQTDFEDVDFPAGSVSPGTKVAAARGWTLTWSFANLISGQSIGMTMPQKLNPGPFAARVTFFAPVSLLFFLTVMVMRGMTTGRSLHPMHYWFLAASFFAFHLLLAYLVDHIGVHTSFAIAAAVSVGLVVSYLRVAAGQRHTLLFAAASQVVFLVLFSYAFFFEGFTGLAITIGAIVTLFGLMQMTARVSWDEVFGSGAAIGAVEMTAAEKGAAR
jgi:inner membrane protein involved in colicin E2 resistance